MTRLLSAVVAASLAVTAASADDKKPAAGPFVGHMVYFKLKDGSPAARAKLIEACDKYLGGHAGVVFYSAGPISDEFKRDVNDREWDVALHLVFVNKAAHDVYQDHPDHQKFIAENKETWAKVRVFDSALATVKGGKTAAPATPKP